MSPELVPESHFGKSARQHVNNTTENNTLALTLLCRTRVSVVREPPNDSKRQQFDGVFQGPSGNWRMLARMMCMQHRISFPPHQHFQPLKVHRLALF